MNTLSRRTVLAGLAGAFASGCLPREGTKLFPLSVAAGDALADGALLWTHYTGPDALSVAVWPEQGDPATASRQSASGEDGYCVVEVDGLQPGTWYLFRFESEDGDRKSVV